MPTIGTSRERARAAWAWLIRKGYEARPLECPKCRCVKSGPMRGIALIDDPAVVREALPANGYAGSAFTGNNRRLD